jgi:hypothetical protein
MILRISETCNGATKVLRLSETCIGATMIIEYQRIVKEQQ